MDYNKELRGAIAFIENNLYEPIKVSDVAAAVSYSYYHFQRYFNIFVGESVGSYIRNRRLTQAAWDLVHTQKKVLDIGLSLHFESAESFTRAFKNRYVITPTAYRKNGVDALIYARNPVSINEIDTIKVNNLEPEIITIPEIHIVGKRFKTSISENSSAFRWEQFNKTIEDFTDKNLNEYKRYEIYETTDACSSQLFSEKSEANTFIGIEESAILQLEENMQLKKLCKGKYAKFIHVGTVDTLLLTYQYIWGVWFPKCGYELAKRDDFECYTKRFLGPKCQKSEIEIFFPIK